MILSFASKDTQNFYKTGRSKKVPNSLWKIALRKLDYLNAAVSIEDLKVPPGNMLEALKGNYKGKYSIRINKQYRIVFTFKNSNAYDVEIVDYH